MPEAKTETGPGSAINADIAEVGLPMPRRIGAIIAVSAGSALYTLDGNIANVALPEIARHLQVESSTAIILVSAYNLTLAMVLLPLAAIGDRFGHRRVYTFGLTAYLAAAAACYFSSSIWLLACSRILQAMAASGLLSMGMGLVRAIYPPEMLGRGLGFNTMISSAGAAIAPVLGGYVIALSSWHFVFASGVPFALLSLAFVHALPHSERRSEPFDTIGAILCALTFGCVIFGLQLMSQGASKALSVGFLAMGVVLVVQFVRHEHRAASPVLPIDLLMRPALSLSVVAALLAVLASTLLMLFVPFRLSALGFDVHEIGTMIAPFAIATLIAAPISGMLSDKVPPQHLGIAGLSLASLGSLAFVWLPAAPHYGEVAWRAVLCGIGFSMFFSPNGRLMLASAPRTRIAGASSLLSTTRMFGQALGSVMLSGLFVFSLGIAAPAWAAALLASLALLAAIGRLFASDPAGA